jgi:hypothetical protein
VRGNNAVTQYDSTKYPAGEGKSEKIVGKAIKQNGKRQHIVLAALDVVEVMII